MLKLPLVKLQDFDNPETRDATLEILDGAAERYGFFNIIDTSFDQDLRDKLFKLSGQYFSQPFEKKNQDASSATHIVRGYSGPGSDKLATTQGKYAADLVEKFVIGPEKDPTFLNMLPEGYQKLYGQNIWPKIPDFQETYLQYMGYLESFSLTLVKIFEQALQLLPNALTENLSRSPNNLRINHYNFAESDTETQVHLGEHTDFGLFSILLTDGEPGLEVKVGEDWLEIEHQPDSFIVNAADVMSIITNNRWLSSLHRVRRPHNNAPRERTSIVYFVDGNHDWQLTCLPWFCESSEWKYSPCTVSEHFTNKVNAMRFGKESTAQNTRI